MLGQFGHIIDIAPTVYEVAGVTAPESHRGVPQMPLHGRSLAYTFDDPDAEPPSRSQYFEMFGNRGLWSDGWKVVTHHEPGSDYSEQEWELYHLDEDFSESRDLAATHPQKLRELTELWWMEAGRYDVLPLDDRSRELFGAPPPPGTPQTRAVFEYYPPVSHIEPSAAPPLGHADHRITARMSGDMRGVIVSLGNVQSGFVLWAGDGSLHYEYNAAGEVTSASLPVPEADEADEVTATFEMRLRPDRSARGRLSANDLCGDWFEIPRTLAFLALSGMDVGRNLLSPVSNSYEPPFPFAGNLHKVTVELDKPDIPLDLPLDD